MPAFRVTPSIAPATYVQMPTRIWSDPASIPLGRPSRITPADNRQHRYYRAAPGETVRLAARLDGDSVVRDDTETFFTAWAVEYGSPYPPPKTYPIALTSAIVDFRLDYIGHYLLAMRSENIYSDPNTARGVVLVHIDVTEF